MATRADLNQVEFETIAGALPWALGEARSLGPEGVLDYGFTIALHRRMFGSVWTWAGTQRQRVTNIGVEPTMIASECRLLFDDANHWHEHAVFPADELAARIHCRLVSIHPFLNGNGRCTRLMADLYLTSTAAEPFSWGAESLDVDGSSRATYIAALRRAAKEDDYDPLIRFARGER